MVERREAVMPAARYLDVVEVAAGPAAAMVVTE
jgi:hypothetical protein